MNKTSPLADMHRSRGAVFSERDGWLLPEHFGDPGEEYRSVRAAAGLLDLSHRALMQFTGPDRLSFLQGMLSNDLRQLQPFQGQYAAVLTQQGKVIADVRVLCSLNSFYIDCWEHLKRNVLDHLNRYLVADEVEIADRSDEYATLSLQGPHSEDLLRELVGKADLPQRIAAHVMVDVEGAAVCAVGADHTGESGFDLIVPVDRLAHVARRLDDLAGRFSSRWIGEEAHNVLRVEAGIPRASVDFTEDNLVLEAGLDHAVNFHKGCYLGQEVVERIRSRGHVNRKLCGLLIDARVRAEAGDPVAAGGKEVGKITSSVMSPRYDRPIALGYIHRDFWTPDTKVEVQRGDARLPAVIVGLPFSSVSP